MDVSVTSKVIKFSLGFEIVIIITLRQLRAYETPIGSRQYEIYFKITFLVMIERRGVFRTVPNIKDGAFCENS